MMLMNGRGTRAVCRATPRRMDVLFYVVCLLMVLLPLTRTQTHGYESYRFRESLYKALEDVGKILDTTRDVRLAEDVPHVYQDKYLLANLMTNSALAAYLTVFQKLGLTDEQLDTMLEWYHLDKQSVTLRFQGSVESAFKEEKEVKVTSAEYEIETEEASGYFSGNKKDKKVKVSDFVTEYHWDISFTYRLSIFSGNSADDSSNTSMELRSREASTTIITLTEQDPIGSKNSRTFDVKLNWFLENIARTSPTDNQQRFIFAIDRMDKKGCKTPRRNKQVQDAIEFVDKMHDWSYYIRTYLMRVLDDDIVGKHRPAGHNPKAQRPMLRDITSESVFIPVLPFMENGTLLTNDVDRFLYEHAQSLDNRAASLENMFPTPDQSYGSLTLFDDAMTYELVRHFMLLGQSLCDGLDYIEGMLEQQLIAAIGKRIGYDDFEEFMRFHVKHFFDDRYIPEPFARAIRQPGKYPDGILSIEPSSSGSSENLNVNTLLRRIPGNSSAPILIPINAATSVQITGDRFLHGWLQHTWSNQPPDNSNMGARARQLSSFLLIVGSMAGPDEFTPKQAIILRNKDEVLIPLLTEVFPSAKEFRDAIISLSPEQQEFAKSFRSMQLQSSVFGVCVIQLKPQLEKVLNLPSGALTKEIQLTEDLMSLFVDYQIPSDLLSYDDSEDADAHKKVEMVRGHVASVKNVIEDTKKKQLEEAEKKKEMYKTRYEYTGEFYPSAMPSASPSAMPSASPSVMPRSFDAMAGGAANVKARARTLSAATSNLHGMEAKVAGTLAEETEAVEKESTHTSETHGQEDGVKDKDNLQGEIKMKNEDITQFPVLLDAKLLKYDADGSLRSAKIKASSSWMLKRQKSLLSPMETTSLYKGDIDTEKSKAFDLLDAISRSGTLSIESSELHVVISVAHGFEHSLMETVIEDNINPIEKVEKSLILLASTVHGVPAKDLFGSSRLDNLHRMITRFPELFDEAGSEEKTHVKTE